MKYRKIANMMSEATAACMDYIEAKEAEVIARDLHQSKCDLDSFNVAIGWRYEAMKDQDEAFDRFIDIYKFFLLELKIGHYTARLKAMLKDMGLGNY